MSNEELTTIAQIVANYTNPDQKIRSESEKYISNLRNNSMGAVCFCLLKVTTLDNISTTTKLTSLVLLRKIINVDSKDKWGDMDEQTKESIKSLVLDLFIKETDLNVKSKYCDVITEIVDNTADYNEKWPKLVELSYSLNKYDINDSNNVLIVESLIKMITDSSGFLYEDITKKYDEFLMFFDKVFKTCNFIQLKVRTAKIISELLAFGDKKENEQARIFRNARWKYTQPEKNFMKYYNNELEKDARDAGEKAKNIYNDSSNKLSNAFPNADQRLFDLRENFLANKIINLLASAKKVILSPIQINKG